MSQKNISTPKNLPNDAYYNLFQNDPVGKQIFEEMCAQHYDIQSYDSDNTHNTSFNEGRREVIRWLMIKMQLADLTEGIVDDESLQE